MDRLDTWRWDPSAERRENDERLMIVLTAFTWLANWFRFPLSHCQRCGYNLKDKISGVCPECGTSLKKDNAAEK